MSVRARGEDRMEHGRAKVPAALQHASGLGDDAVEVVDVHQRHVGDRERERRVRERKRCRVGDDRLVPLARQLDHARRRVDADHVVAPLGQHRADSALAAADVQCSSARRREAARGRTGSSAARERGRGPGCARTPPSRPPARPTRRAASQRASLERRLGPRLDAVRGRPRRGRSAPRAARCPRSAGRPRRRRRSPPGSRRPRARGSAAGAAPRRRSAGRRCPARKPSPSRIPSSWSPNESVTPASNQQIIPALEPARTIPNSHASRSSSSKPCTRQTASMFAVLPPPTKIASNDEHELAESVWRVRVENEVVGLTTAAHELVEREHEIRVLHARRRHVERARARASPSTCS